MISLRDKLLQRVEMVPIAGCWLWTRALDSHGYGNIWVQDAVMKAHRASWLVHVGPIPDGLHVCHRCDTPACINPAHLFLGTAKQNMEDREAKARGNHVSAPGEKHYRARLTWAIVREIRASSEPATQLAKRYGVGSPAIDKIRWGQNWKERDGQAA